MKRIGLVLILALMAGCGGEGSSDAVGSETDGQKADIRLNRETDVSIGDLDVVKFLGEVINNGDTRGCPTVVIESFNASGELIGRDSSAGGGTIVLAGGTVGASCIDPGQKSPFRVINTTMKRIPSTFKEKITFFDDTPASKVLPSQVTLADDIDQGLSEDGVSLKFTGTIRNKHADLTILPSITFAAFNGNVLIDTGEGGANRWCREFGSSIKFSCVRPFDSSDFTVLMNVPPSEITRFYFVIDYFVLDCFCTSTSPPF